jgi:anti-anti-sigma factor
LSPPEPQQVRSGTLALQLEHEGETRTLRLRGELDLANAEMLEAELGKALDDDASRVLVDMRELTFIDSTGIAILVAAMNRGGDRLRFLPSEAPAVTRVLQLTGVEQRMALLESSSGENQS